MTAIILFMSGSVGSTPHTDESGDPVLHCTDALNTHLANVSRRDLLLLDHAGTECPMWCCRDRPGHTRAVMGWMMGAARFLAYFWKLCAASK